MNTASPESVAVAGNIVIDLLARPVTSWKWGATTWIEQVAQSLGGNGANTSFALARLGIPVRLYGWVGNDSLGDYALATLARGGVNIDEVVRCAAPTATTVALVHPQGERAFLHAPGASLEAFPPSWRLSPSGARFFHLANVFAIPHLRRHGHVLLAAARAAGMRTSLDTGWDARGVWLADLAPCLPLTDILFANETEAMMLAGADHPSQAAEFLLRSGVPLVVLKRGAQGCRLVEAGAVRDVPACRVTVVDTTGAGDCFAGGFLAALARGYPLLDAARLANAVAALSVSALGATTGLRSWDDTLNFLASSRPPAPEDGSAPSLR